MNLLEDYIKSLKKNNKTLKELQLEELLYISKLYLEQESTANTSDYVKMLEALEKLRKKSFEFEEDIKKMAGSVLERIMPQLQQIWNSVEAGDE